MKTPLNKKTISREFAFKFLYNLELKSQLDNTSEDISLLVEEFEASYLESDHEHAQNYSLDPKSKQFAMKLILGVLQYKDVLEEKIKESLINKKFQNLEKIVITILYLGAYELLYIKETSAKIVINEAINMGRKYGDKDSFSFINGVLNYISKV
ncbi:MAG: transcription antitermination factor NusB [Bacteriovoracaceae bacterium]|nr:transcription antitermination factor NusB [Bacteriovoracaceae bacterium]